MTDTPTKRRRGKLKGEPSPGSGRTPTKTNAKAVEYYLSQPARDIVAEHATRDGVSRSEMVERMIMHYHETPRIF